MKKAFRKLAITAIAALTMSVAVNAQKQGDMAVGGNLTLGVGNSYSNFGITGKFMYNLLDPLRLEVARSPIS